jgi:hypothetical protein
MQGGFRNNEFPQVAVDRSHTSSRGTVYMAWSDGSNNIVPDLPRFFDSYAYPDIVVAKSIDRGNTFTVPQVVSPMSPFFGGKGRDQLFPGLAVDRDANVGVCYYDRRQNPLNLLLDRYCSVSQNHGRTWDESRVSRASWVPAHDSDGVINTAYIGDMTRSPATSCCNTTGSTARSKCRSTATRMLLGRQSNNVRPQAPRVPASTDPRGLFS